MSSQQTMPLRGWWPRNSFSAWNQAGTNRRCAGPAEGCSMWTTRFASKPTGGFWPYRARHRLPGCLRTPCRPLISAILPPRLREKTLFALNKSDLIADSRSANGDQGYYLKYDGIRKV